MEAATFAGMHFAEPAPNAQSAGDCFVLFTVVLMDDVPNTPMFSKFEEVGVCGYAHQTVCFCRYPVSRRRAQVFPVLHSFSNESVAVPTSAQVRSVV
jgi:hypothetical protein